MNSNVHYKDRTIYSIKDTEGFVEDTEEVIHKYVLLSVYVKS